ncbi:MAG TPA: pyridoxal phosphate-dependent aminotransferase [Polyangiaceae bacterium]|nr:pyridoxal phosphate-dependent aminotransferase [Polyangiaceae bacterium]
MYSLRSHFDLTPNRIAQAIASVRKAGRPLLDLTESNPTKAAIPCDGPAVLAALAAPASLVYEPSALGTMGAREAVASYLAAEGIPIEPAHIALTTSTSEAYAFAFKLLCDPGDEVLVPQPSYPLFEHLAALECVRPVGYRLAYDGAWHIDLPSLRSALSERSRAIVCVNPNNPTGSYVKAAELAALASLGLPIVSDEVFAPYALRDDPTRARSAIAAPGAPLVLALGGLSKSAALPQMKLGWMALSGEPARVDEALDRLELIADAFLSVGAPVQHALPALFAAGSISRQAIRARTRANVNWLAAAVLGSPASLLDVEGGWYAVLRIPGTRSEEEWVSAFVTDDGVLVHPGHFFDFESEAYVVMSLLTPEPILREGCARILARIAGESGASRASVSA